MSKAIHGICDGAGMLSEDQGTEERIKDLSRNGSLKGYKIMHFSLQGFIIPEMPELTCLACSFSDGKKTAEDGFLNLREIRELKLEADVAGISGFEVLPASFKYCEGVPMLCRAFIDAGANGVIFTLHPANESAAVFWENAYRLGSEKGMEYGAAVSETKRAMIAGSVSVKDKTTDFNPAKYRAPFYWAPCVYYGR